MEDGPAEKLKSPMESLELLNVKMGPGSSDQKHKKDSSGMCSTSVDWFTLRLPFPFQII